MVDDSFLMQDEPELGPGFSCKMSLKGRYGMLSIDHQDGRFSCNESGADPGIGGCQQRDAICRAAAAGGIRVGGADTGSAPVRRPAEARQGRSTTLSGADDRFETSSGDAPDHRV